MGGVGRTAQIRSSGETSPPSVTIAMTPALKRGPDAPPSRRLFNPDLKRSMRKQGVRRPVSSSVAEPPSISIVPSGRHSRSSPTVAMFSPRSLLELQMARRELSEPFGSSFRLRSVMHEQRQKKNDRKRDTDQPKQSASTKAHDGLHSFCCVINSAVIHKFRI